MISKTICGGLKFHNSTLMTIEIVAINIENETSNKFHEILKLSPITI